MYLLRLATQEFFAPSKGSVDRDTNVKACDV